MIPLGVLGSAHKVAATGGTYSSEVLADSPYVYLGLDDASGTVAVDSSGNARDGTYAWGAPTFGTPPLAGSGTSITYGGDAASAIDTPVGAASWTAMTIELWWKYTTASTPMSVWRDNTAAGGWYLQVDGTNIAVRIAGTTTTTTVASSTVKDGLAHHLVLVKTTTNATLYIDGVSVYTWATSAAVSTFAGPLRVGQNGTNNQPCKGVYDQVAVYGAALTSTRIAAHYAAR